MIVMIVDIDGNNKNDKSLFFNLGLSRHVDAFKRDTEIDVNDDDEDNSIA
jgi:hypothetical protein